MNFQEPIGGLVERIARALERLAPASPRKPDFDKAEAFIWQAKPEAFLPVGNVNRVPLSLLKGIDRMRDVLHDNTVRFAGGLPANNALLWGARGTGKSSLVKAVHAAVGREAKSQAGALKLVEIHREDIGSLPRCLAHLRETKGKRFILFCDDLSFEGRDTSYKSLKAVLEGGIEGRPEHVLFYATSNRRHLMPRDELDGGNPNDFGMQANSGQREAVDEMLSLSDRFGLWLGFHTCSQDTYLEMVRGYAEHYGLHIADDDLRREALEWALARGSRSGRVAFQYIQDLAGRLGVRLYQT
jgi:predicted AAA+ superfamily ATPase